MILITGATGTIGRAVLARLDPAGEPIRAFARDTTRIPAVAGVEGIQGDFEDAASLERAMDGVRAVFMLSPAGPASVRTDQALVQAARHAGVSKLVKLSSIGAGSAHVAAADWHSEGEQAVRASGMASVLLRPSAYAANALRWAHPVRAGQPVPNLTGSATQGVVDERDVAEVAVAALTTSAHDNRVYTLTGPELLSTADQAALLGEALGQDIKTIDIPLETARREMLGSGMDAAFVEAAIRGIEIIAAGHNAVLTSDVQRVLGRRATSFAAWAQDQRHRFTDHADGSA
jgi:uncharacterized protein YbjT (DUF2867 family)